MIDENDASVATDQEETNIRSNFQTFLEAGFELAIEKNAGKVIADLSTTGIAHRNDNKTGKGSLKILLGKHESGHGRIGPSFKVVANGEELFEWGIVWGLDSPPEMHFRANGFGKTWMFCGLANDESSDDDEFSYSHSRDLPRVKPLVSEHFIRFWFSDSEDKAARKGLLDLKRLGNHDTAFDEAWSKITFDGAWFQITTAPDYPTFDGGEMDTALAQKWAELFFVLLCWRFICVCCPSGSNSRGKLTKLLKDGTTNLDTFYKNLPEDAEYKPKRPVDINPHDLYDQIRRGLKENAKIGDGLQVPWHVVASVTAALNAGKHIIFTGPPGCGKTHIAKIISSYVSDKLPIMATASQAWSTDEVIGRYMPAPDGRTLEFKEGVFLRALNNSQWLIIDEINRCDIDNCFGELFTVLSGHSVLLPFEKMPEDEKKKPLPIRIQVGSGEEDSEDYESYVCSERFRLLATMNDADIAGLNQLSYALRRRFSIIRVDAPDDEVKRKIFAKRIKEVYADLDLKRKGYKLFVGKANGVEFLKLLPNMINKLFAKISAKGDGDDLIDLRVVGIAPVLDVIRFVGEGLRSSSDAVVLLDDGSDLAMIKAHLVNSFLAMGIVLNVFPQLDAITGESGRFEKVIACILDAFRDDKACAKDHDFWHIEKDDKPETKKPEIKKQETKEQPQFRLRKKGTIRKYLLGELKQRYATDFATLNLLPKSSDDQER